MSKHCDWCGREYKFSHHVGFCSERCYQEYKANQAAQYPSSYSGGTSSSSGCLFSLIDGILHLIWKLKWVIIGVIIIVFLFNLGLAAFMSFYEH